VRERRSAKIERKGENEKRGREITREGKRRMGERKFVEQKSELFLNLKKKYVVVIALLIILNHVIHVILNSI
jgi:hypothetical protein